MLNGIRIQRFLLFQKLSTDNINMITKNYN